MDTKTQIDGRPRDNPISPPTPCWRSWSTQALKKTLLGLLAGAGATVGVSCGIGVPLSPHLNNVPATTKPASAAEPVTEAAPTAATLQKWLESKEVVEVCFAGPHMEPTRLKNSLKTKGADDDRTFLLTPGEGGGANRSFVTVIMNVTPRNAQRLLGLGAELAPRGYAIDPKDTHVWSFTGDAQTQKEARELVRGALAAAAAKISQAFPQAKYTAEKMRTDQNLGGFKYEIPQTQIRGMVRVSEITPDMPWNLNILPDQTIHLPRMGLMVTAYYRPGEVGEREDNSPQRAKIREAVSDAMGPLMKLEGGAQVRQMPLMSATQPAKDHTNQLR